MERGHSAPGKAKEVAIGGSGHEEGWGKPSASACIPGGIRAGVHSHHFLMSSVLQKLAPVLGNLGGISVKPSSVETDLSLGAEHSVQRNSLQGNKIFFPSHVLETWHHVPPQNNTPNTSTHKKLCMTDMGTTLEQSLHCCQGKHSAPKREDAAGTRRLSSLSQRGRPPASPILPNTELPLLSVTSPGRELPYCIHATKLAANI